MVTRKVLIGFPGDSDGKESTCNAGEPSSIPGLGRSPGEGNHNPFQYSCLENSMNRGAQQATVHGAAKNQTQLSTILPSLGSLHRGEISWSEISPPVGGASKPGPLFTHRPSVTLCSSRSGSQGHGRHVVTDKHS